MSRPVMVHDPGACRLCKVLSAERYRRYWKHQPKAGPWHLVADGPDLMARLPPQAHFITILSHRTSPDDRPIHYRGSLYWEGDATDAALAFADVRRCVELLTTIYECPPEAIRIWHSGGRGSHVTIPPLVLGADAGHAQLPRIYAAMIGHLFPPALAPTIDRTVYSAGNGRMWRLPNRRRRAAPGRGPRMCVDDVSCPGRE